MYDIMKSTGVTNTINDVINSSIHWTASSSQWTSMYNTSTLKLAHLNGMQPLLKPYIKPVLLNYPYQVWHEKVLLAVVSW